MAYRRSAERHSNTGKRMRADRLAVVSAVLFVATAVIVARLFYLQVVRHGMYEAQARGQSIASLTDPPQRGEVYIRDAGSSDALLPLITNRQRQLIYAIPAEVKDPLGTSEKLSDPLNIDKAVLLEKLSKPGDTYEALLRGTEANLAKKVVALKLPGIVVQPEEQRYYPFADVASQLTGFVGYKGDARVGQYGLEGYFDGELSGISGTSVANDPLVGNVSAAQQVSETRDGDSLVLTIDRTVQTTACIKLQEAVLKHGADGGTVIIVQPATGNIIALCGFPSFDANSYAQADSPSRYINQAVSQQYEPGSVMKAMTLSAGVNEGLITPETTYEDTGSVQIGKYTIRNSDNKTYGTQSMSDVLEQSINTGAMFVEDKLGQATFRQYLKNFGFGEKTGVTLQGEAKGDLSSLNKKGDIYAATASFGQGVSVTPIQMVMAYAALANGGVLMQPRIVDSTIRPSGYKQTTTPQSVRQVVSAETARTMMAMLVNVVRKGHGKRAAVDGYYIGGKTGTAQVPYHDRSGYDPSKHNGTFVGFGPMSNPQFVMLVLLNTPRDVEFAESSAAPLFGDIADFLVHYYQIPKDDTQATTTP